jgi:hypothetical protein
LLRFANPCHTCSALRFTLFEGSGCLGRNRRPQTKLTWDNTCAVAASEDVIGVVTGGIIRSEAFGDQPMEQLRIEVIDREYAAILAAKTPAERIAMANDAHRTARTILQSRILHLYAVGQPKSDTASSCGDC